ncbi:MAG TPA: hypothetical protein VGW33_14875 [Terriglobia bacterium]|nr:hypothetical protein [Terriglobia bacterium]
MNCIQFEQQVHDLALEKLGERALDEALAHAELCAGCAHLLADSRALRSGLRALAEEGAEDGPRQAPPRLEAILLAAFRRERRAQVIRVRRNRWVLIGMAAAAALLVAVGVRDWRRANRQPAAHGPLAAGSAQSGNAAGGAANAAAKAPSSRPWPRRPAPARTSGVQPKHRAVPERQKPQRRSLPSAGKIEWATDFMPLPGADGAASPEAGELVRVELSRSTVTELGLPAAGEAGAETITAQVFIGDDGVARAIRFAQ